jgi:group II intron reverse transcriptase/maturase
VLKRDAAPGMDGLTWQAYAADLEQNLTDLHARVHRGAYRATPSRRTYIPKADGRQRPLAVAALEGKIVQRATVAVLNCIYEEEFLGFSYGFRPKRGQHDALDALAVGITDKKVNFILDADVRSFFDEVSQSWLIRFVEHRIADPRIIRLIQKWLKAGVLEDGVVTVSEKGTGQVGDFATARQRLPALCVRSVGRALATARGHGWNDDRAVCRRYRRWLCARGRCPALRGRASGLRSFRCRYIRRRLA